MLPGMIPSSPSPARIAPLRVKAREFTNVIGCTGIVLTKLDGTSKGGVVLAIAEQLNLPVRFIGTGEGMEDLAPFDPQGYVDALFGVDAQGASS